MTGAPSSAPGAPGDISFVANTLVLWLYVVCELFVPFPLLFHILAHPRNAAGLGEFKKLMCQHRKGEPSSVGTGGLDASQPEIFYSCISNFVSSFNVMDVCLFLC